jgi:hypothetical protein
MSLRDNAPFSLRTISCPYCRAVSRNGCIVEARNADNLLLSAAPVVGAANLRCSRLFQPARVLSLSRQVVSYSVPLARSNWKTQEGQSGVNCRSMSCAGDGGQPMEEDVDTPTPTELTQSGS